MSRVGRLFGSIGVVLILITLFAGNALAETTDKVGQKGSHVFMLSDDTNTTDTKVTAFSDKWAVAPGDNFTVSFAVYGVTNLYGASLDLKFDNSILEVVSEADIQPGDIFAGLDQYSDYSITIPKVASDYDGDGSLTIADVNEVGVINFVAHLLGSTNGFTYLDGNWHSFVKITFKVKGDISSSYFYGREYLPIELFFEDYLADNFSDPANNGLAVVKLANSSDDFTSGTSTNKISYQGFDVGGLILPPLESGEYRAVLEWDWDPRTCLRELDAHMLVPVGDKQIDVTWDNEGSLIESPYAAWIGDLGYDSEVGRNYCIPAEVITLSQTSSGIYEFFVEDFDEERFDGVNPKVTFYDINGVIKDGYGVEASYDFNLAQNMGKGSIWDVFSFSAGQIQHKNAVVIERYVDVILPAESLVESSELTTSFNVTVETENFDSLNADEVKVRMFDRFNNYEGTYVGTNEYDDFIFSFSGVKAGYYDVEAWVRDVYGEENVFVDSYQSKPVIYRITPWAVPTGHKSYWIRLHGYNLGLLNTGVTKVELKDSQGNIVATTDGTVNIGYEPESDYEFMKVELRAEGETILPSPSYDVVITNSENNWNEVIGNRYKDLLVTDKAALGDYVYPWVLGAGATEYSLRFEGINLHTLDDGNVIVELLNDNRSEVIATASSIEINAKDMDWGLIKANFSGTAAQLPEGNVMVHPIVKDNGQILAGADHYDVEVVDYPVVYGLENDRVIPGKTSYVLLIKGWNLDSNKDYRVEVEGDNGFYFETFTYPNYNNTTDMSFNLEYDDGLDEGWYSIDVYEIYGADDEKYIGTAWLNAEPEWIKVEPFAVPFGYSNTAIILKEDLEDGQDIWSAGELLEVRLTREDGLRMGYVTNEVTENQVTFTLLAGTLPVGNYHLELLKGNIPIAQSWFGVYLEPSVNIEVPDLLTEGSDGSGVDFDATITTQNIDLDGFNPDQDAEVWMHGEFNKYKGTYDADQSVASSGILVFHFSGVEAGHYDMSARVRDGFEEKDVWVQSYDYKPVVYRVQPKVQPAGNKYLCLELQGYNIISLNHESVVELLYKGGPNVGQVAATTVGDENWLGISYDSHETDCIKVNMKAIGDTMLSGFYELRITDDTGWFDPSIGLRANSVEFTEDAVLVGIDPYRLGAGAENYFINVHGINLHQLDSADLSVQMENKDKNGNVIWTTTTTQTEIVEKDGDYGYIRADFVGSSPLPQYELDLRVAVMNNGIPLRENDEIWVKTTYEPVIFGVTPNLVSPGNTSYSFTLHGWNLEDLDLSNYTLIEVKGSDGYNIGLEDYSLSINDGNITLNINLYNSLSKGCYEISINDTTYGYPGKHVGKVSFDAEPGGISIISPSSGILKEGYADTAITIEDETTDSYIWNQSDTLDVRLMVPNNEGKPDWNANADITNIQVNSDTVEFTLGSGLGQNTYLVEVLRNGILIGKGAQIQVTGTTSTDTTPPELYIMSPMNNSVVDTVYPTISFVALDNESVISSVYVSVDEIEWTGPINENNNTYSFVPNELSEGSHWVYVKVETEADLYAEKSWMFTVDSSSSGGIEITTDSLPSGTVGDYYEQEIGVNGGISPLTWFLTSGSLPAGLKLDTVNGVVYGTSTQSGNFIFGVKVTDSGDPAEFDEKVFGIYMEDEITPLTITTSSLPNATVGESYSATLEATGGTQPYTWSLAQASSLPGGLSLSTNGIISGIANQEGEYSFSVQVTDNQGESNSIGLTIEVISSSNVVVSIIAPDNVGVGSTFVADVYISALENKNLVTADVQIKFDPNKLRIVEDGTGVTIGALLGGTGRDIIKNEYDNLNGTVWFGISNTNGAIIDNNGGGILVTLKFVSLTEGTSVIHFDKINPGLPSATSLIDSSVNDIQHSVNQKTIEVISGVTVSGKVLLQGRTLFGDSIITVVSVDPSNPNQYQGYTQSDGIFIINGIAPGKYRVTAEHTSYLKTDLMILDTSSETNNLIIPDCQLLAGDTDGDGVIFTKDVTRIKLKYGSSVVNDSSDLDGDGIIFTKDVTRVKLNYGKSYVPLTTE